MNAAVRCPTCPDHPVLDAPADTDVRKCVRCQGEHRWLPLPHPEDHLFEVCRSECPQCKAPAGPGRGGLCAACQGRCRLCGGPLPAREETVEVAPPLAGGKHERLFFPATSSRTMCDGCLEARGAGEHTVLRAFPDKLIRACGGSAPARAMQVIRAELAYVPAQQLAERIERRWWGRWAHRPLSRPHTGDDDVPAYGPDDVAVSLVEPTACPLRCEDGWDPAGADRPCPRCRPQQSHRVRAISRSPVGDDMLAAARAALDAHKGRRVRGGYVPEERPGGRTRYIPEDQ